MQTTEEIMNQMQAEYVALLEKSEQTDGAMSQMHEQYAKLSEENHSSSNKRTWR